MTLNADKVGVAVECDVCGHRKAPIGRSVPLGMYLCDHECTGYEREPKPGSLWPGESEAEFGYPVADVGTTCEFWTTCDTCGLPLKEQCGCPPIEDIITIDDAERVRKMIDHEKASMSTEVSWTLHSIRHGHEHLACEGARDAARHAHLIMLLRVLLTLVEPEPACEDGEVKA